MLEVNPRIRIPLRELHFDYVRSEGAGGQHVNKVSTKAVLRWDVVHSPSLGDAVRRRFRDRFGRRINDEGEVVISCGRTRSQARNAEECLERLRAMLLEVASPPRRRRPTRPTKGSKERRLKEKRQRAERKRQRRSPPGEE